MTPSTEQRPLGELFSELASETATLVRHEVELAKVETTAKLKTAAMTAAQLAAGGAIALLGALALLAGVILVLGLAIPLWASALVVGILISAVGGFLVVRSLAAFKRFDIAPRETLQALRDDKQWLREQVSR